MSLLTIVQRFCSRTGLAVPATVYGTADPQIRQIMALLEEEGNDLSGRGDWNELTFQATHTTTAAEDQGDIDSIATNGYRYIKNNTFWDRTLQEPVYGPLNDQDWQAIKAMTVTGPRYQWRIRGGHLLSNPVPTAGHTWAFEYVSWNWMTDSTGATYRQYFAADGDLPLLPEEILTLGLRWRWKKEKGFDYAEDFRTYESMVKDALGRDGGKRTLNMGGDGEGKTPRVFLPAGSWITP